MKRIVISKNCHICNKHIKYISRHLKYNHKNYNIKQYYDEFIKKDTDGICPKCGKNIPFDNRDVKYHKFCSKKCSTDNAKYVYYHDNKYQKTRNEAYKKVSKKFKKFLKSDVGKAYIKKLSLSRMGKDNPVYRQSVETRKKTAEKMSIIMKEKILNGTFTPYITNSWANSKCRLPYNKKFYRSSWEIVFQILNPKCLFENLRIPYISTDNKQHIYIVDFINNDTREIFEIKPKCKLNVENNIRKQAALIKWCKLNNYNCNIITDDWFKINAKFVDYSKLDPKIKRNMRQFLK